MFFCLDMLFKYNFFLCAKQAIGQQASATHKRKFRKSANVLRNFRDALGNAIHQLP